MEALIIKSQQKIRQISVDHKRYLYAKINRNSRMIAIKGARGVGKTTLLLQLGKERKANEVLYVALDDLFFSNNTLHSLADAFSKTGGNLLLIDEVHKYPNWSRELKLIYDDFPKLQVVFTSSSILEIYKGESDLSRRVVSYNLSELSFREYLAFRENIALPTFSLEEILEKHQEISAELIQQFTPFKYFSDYLRFGAFPFFEGDESEYYQKLRNTINLIIEVDVQIAENIEFNGVAMLKRLLFVISSNVPFTPNINKLSTQIGLNRNAMVRALQLLEKAALIHTLYKQSKSITSLNKPDKIWMHNTNFMYAISDKQVDKGNLRETFFIQSMPHAYHLSLPEKGDVLVNNKYLFEIGGKNKTKKQIQGLENAFVVKDDIETGVFNNIPLWLFGFQY
jgi:predicted AAA+ superfamily ATPase